VEKVIHKTLFQRIKKERSAYLFILPAFLLFIFFAFKPLMEAIKLSFYQENLKAQTFIGIKNYIQMIGDPLFWLELKNTFLFVSLLVPLIVGLALSIALIIAKFGKIMQSFFRGAFYLPVVSAGVVMSMVWAWIFHPVYGLLNYVLSLISIGPIPWLATPTTARLAVITVVLHWTIGSAIIIYLSALSSIPKGLYEAAEIDGAGSWHKFAKITIPLVSPTTVFLLVTNTIGVFQIWKAIFLMTSGGPAYTTTSIVYRVYRLGFLYYRFGQASAHAVVLLVVIFVISFLQFKYLNKKLEY